MKSPSLAVFALASILALLPLAAARAEEPGFAEGTKLLTKYKCQQCHSLDKAGPGPSLRAVAKRYASDPDARVELQTIIRNGSTGAWGPTPMAGVDVPEGDLKRLVAFILSLKEY
jgi:cytochrome c